ncbi:DUF4347 domain-containing protein [Methylomicrobium lacus]|uniref:DUF4347 domain-containing protein n=1 Tax=Methylomicrobium lacus TaxID=136992 RepID=UPI0035A862E1
MSTRIVFIDSRINAYKSLIAELPADADYFFLTPDRDGLEQIAESLVNRSDLDAIDIFSPGSPGSLTLGSSVLNGDNVANQAALLAEIGSHLTENGDILLYGSDVAQGEGGLAFIEQLAQVTGADVEASTDLTGAADLGGNWQLEAQTGTIESASIQPAAYSGVLTVPTFKVTTDFGGSDDFGRSVTVQTDGKILVSGYSWNGNDYDFALARYNVDGTAHWIAHSVNPTLLAKANLCDWKAKCGFLMSSWRTPTTMPERA